MISFTEYLEEGKRGLWDNIHAKQERIKNGSGERMRKPGSKGAPTAAALKASQNEEVETLDELKHSTVVNYMRKAKTQLGNIAVSRRAGDPEFGKETARKRSATLNKIADKTDSRAVADNIRKVTAPFNKEEAEAQFDLIEEMIEEMAVENNLDVEQVWENIKDFTDDELIEACTCWQGYKRKPGTKPCEDDSCVKEDLDEGATADGKGYKSSTGGLTQKGRDHYNSTTGSHLKAPVTTPPSKLKKGSKAANRRKSFCARMGGMEGPMRKPNGEPTRKALALRKWNC